MTKEKKVAPKAKATMKVVKNKPASTKPPTDTQVKKMVTDLITIGRRTLDASLKLGEVLTAKKEQLGHGNWTHYLENIGLGDRMARRLMAAFKNPDKFMEGQTFSTLSDGEKPSKTDNSSDKEPVDKEPVYITDLSDLSKASKSTLIIAIKALKKAIASQLTEDGKARLLSPEQFDQVVFNIVND